MKRSEFLHKVGVLPLIPLIPLRFDSFNPDALARELQDIAERAVGSVGPRTNTCYAATQEGVTAYGLGFEPKSKNKVLFTWQCTVKELVKNSIDRGGPNPVTLYWRRLPTITKSLERPGWWKLHARFLISKKEIPLYDQGFVIDRKHVNKNNFVFLRNRNSKSMILKEAGEELFCGDLVRLGEDNKLYKV